MTKRRTGEGEARTRTTIYRRINPRVHGSEDFLALSSTPSGRALWLFLLSCREMTRIPGVILAGPMALAESIEWEPADFERCLGEILGRGMAKMDRRARVLWLTHAHLQDENRPENPNQILGWRTTWDLIPECDLKAEIWVALRDWMHGGDFPESMLEAFDEACPEPRRNRSGNGSRNGSANGSRNQDQDTGAGTGSRREIARAPDEVIPPGRPTNDGEPSLSLDEPDSVVEPTPLPTPAPEADRPASAKPGGLSRAADVEGDERLRRASIGATTAPPPPDDLLDETTGPRLAIDAYNASKHPSLPEATNDRGTRGAVWIAIRNSRTEARLARERGEPEPEHGLHRLDGWRELGERTHGALFLQPSKTEPCMRPTPGLLFFVKGRDGIAGDQNRTTLYAGTWDERYKRGSSGGPSKSPSVTAAESMVEAQRARIDRDMARARERDANYKPVKPPPRSALGVFAAPTSNERRDSDADPNAAA